MQIKIKLEISKENCVAWREKGKALLCVSIWGKFLQAFFNELSCVFARRRHQRAREKS